MTIDDCLAGTIYALRLKDDRLVAVMYMGGGQFANGEEQSLSEILGPIEVR